MQRRFLSALPLGLVAAAGALGFAAVLSGTTAASARADDLTDILSGVQSDLTNGQAAFADALTDLGSSNTPGALAEFFTGIDDDFVLAPDSFYIGSVQALTGVPVSDAITLGMAPETDLANALADAQSSFTVGQTELADALTALAGGDYAGAATDNALGSFFTFDLPVEQLIMGALGQVGI